MSDNADETIEYLRNAAANPEQALQIEAMSDVMPIPLNQDETTKFLEWLLGEEGQHVAQRLQDAENTQQN